MTDIKDPESRSRNMAAIKSRNTKPEIYIRKLLFSEGYRYRLFSKKIPGHPDIWLLKYNTAIFVNGCFWHRHKNCSYAYFPKSNIIFWRKKFEANLERDEKIKRLLEEENIKQLVIWECTIKSMMKDDTVKKEKIQEVSAFLHDGSKMFKEI